MPGMSIMYQVRRTGRHSKNISVRVDRDGVVRVGAPTWASLKEINRVVQMHAQWIAERIAGERGDRAVLRTTVRCIFTWENAIRLALETPTSIATRQRSADGVFSSRPASRRRRGFAICCAAGIAAQATDVLTRAHRTLIADLPWLRAYAELARAPDAFAVGQLHGLPATSR